MTVFGRLDPTHYVYLLLHLVLVILGYTIYTASANFWLQGVGASISAAGLTGFTVFVYVLLSQETAGRVRIISELGIQAGFAGRGARIRLEYDNRLSRLREQLDVFGFGLRALREDYRDDVKRWITIARVRILLIDPDFPAEHSLALQRDIEEGNTPGAIASDVRQFVDEFKGPIRAGTLQVRLYRCLPSVNIFRIDDELFWGPYLVRQPSRNSPTLLVKRGGVLFDLFVRHFESIWSDDRLSRAVPDEWLA